VRRLLALSILAASSFIARGENWYMPDASDLWWNPNESGWGVNLVEQGTILFATLFVYDANGRAHWYVSPDMQASSLNTPTDQPVTFMGTLYETTGPVAAENFNPSQVVGRRVGTRASTIEGPTPGSSATWSTD
jgi:hypothetical protein